MRHCLTGKTNAASRKRPCPQYSYRRLPSQAHLPASIPEAEWCLAPRHGRQNVDRKKGEAMSFSFFATVFRGPASAMILTTAAPAFILTELFIFH